MTISVDIPLYNEANHLLRVVDPVLAQSSAATDTRTSG